MSRRGYEYLHRTYAAAWRERTTTGNTSEELLIETFRRSTPPDATSSDALPGTVVLGLWNRGIEPRHLKRELYRGLGRAAWNATVVPAKQILGSFRGGPKS